MKNIGKLDLFEDANLLSDKEVFTDQNFKEMQFIALYLNL